VHRDASRLAERHQPGHGRIGVTGTWRLLETSVRASRDGVQRISLVAEAPRIAIVEGDDLSGRLSASELARRETGGKILAQMRDIISANLYLGAQPIAHALDQGADIVVTGRVADSALALGPLLHVFRWRAEDWDRLAAGTLAEFIELARKEPGKLNLGTSAVGTGGYMCAELFKSEAGINVAIIPYKGSAPVMNDLLGGHVPIAFSVLPPALGNIQGGKLRAIAVTSMKRFSLLPDVPTFDESGLPGFDAVLHYGLLAPAGTPKEIVDRLGMELRKLVDLPEVQKQIHNEGGDPLTSTPAEYAADIDREEKKWSGLVKKLGLKVE